MLALGLATVVTLRLALYRFPMQPDEAGFYFIADHWTLHGDRLYGSYWVDRPPGLLLVFKLAALTHHVASVRVLALGAALVFVTLVWWGATLLGRSTLWATTLAVAGVCTPLVQAQTATGQIFAVPFEVAAATLLIRAVRSRPASPFWTALPAGACAAAAVAVKQNFFGGAVFAVVLVVCLRASRRPQTSRIAGGVLLGGAAVAAPVAVFGLLNGGGFGDLWLAVVTFRARATHVILSGSTAGVDLRAHRLSWLALDSGLLLVGVALAVVAGAAGLAAARRTRSPARSTQVPLDDAEPLGPIAVATAAMAAVELLGIVAGGNFWPPYLIGLLPALCLGVALASPGRGAPVLPTARFVSVAVLTTIVSAVLFTFLVARHVPIGHGVPGRGAIARATSPSDRGRVVGRWLAARARPGDTAVVLYGHPEIQLASGLPSPYPYLWSLPIRTLDPRLTLLRRTVTGTTPPTWIVLADRPNSWGLDRGHRFRTLLDRSYVRVVKTCGAGVWLRRTDDRPGGPPPRCR